MRAAGGRQPPLASTVARRPNEVWNARERVSGGEGVGGVCDKVGVRM